MAPTLAGAAKRIKRLSYAMAHGHTNSGLAGGGEARLQLPEHLQANASKGRDSSAGKSFTESQASVAHPVTSRFSIVDATSRYSIADETTCSSELSVDDSVKQGDSLTDLAKSPFPSPCDAAVEEIPQTEPVARRGRAVNKFFYAPLPVPWSSTVKARRVVPTKRHNDTMDLRRTLSAPEAAEADLWTTYATLVESVPAPKAPPTDNTDSVVFMASVSSGPAVADTTPTPPPTSVGCPQCAHCQVAAQRKHILSRLPEPAQPPQRKPPPVPPRLSRPHSLAEVPSTGSLSSTTMSTPTDFHPSNPFLAYDEPHTPNSAPLDSAGYWNPFLESQGYVARVPPNPAVPFVPKTPNVERITPANVKPVVYSHEVARPAVISGEMISKPLPVGTIVVDSGLVTQRLRQASTKLTAHVEEKSINISSKSDVPAHPAGTLLRAIRAFDARLFDELSFSAGDIIVLTYSENCRGFWQGECNGKVGWFPATFVTVVPSESNTNTLIRSDFSFMRTPLTKAKTASTPTVDKRRKTLPDTSKPATIIIKSRKPASTMAMMMPL